MSSNKRYEKIVANLTTSDVVTLLGTFGVPETSIRYTNGYLILPTACHNDTIGQASHKLYYYENTKKFMCYTECGQMSVFDFVINAYKTRGVKYSAPQAALLIEQIIDQRLCNGFAILNPPVAQTLGIEPGEENWKDSFTEYNPAVLDCFSQNKKYLAIWEKEGIGRDTMEKFNIRYDMIRNRMVIPIYNETNKLIGVKVRNFNQWDIDNGRKYMPLIHNNEVYTYEKSKVAYGLNFNRKYIKKTKSVIIFEAERNNSALSIFPLTSGV